MTLSDRDEERPPEQEEAPVQAGAEPVEPERIASALPSARVIQTIDLRQNRIATFAGFLVVAVVVAVVAGLWYGRFAQTESVRGIVSATTGFARIDAPRAG